MVIAGLLAIGFVVLLVAPTIHRRNTASSRLRAEEERVERAKQLRDSPEGSSKWFARTAHAVSARDRLLLRGVRSEVLAEGDGSILIYAEIHEERVAGVLSELGIGEDSNESEG